jgi:hypothetical protein
LEWDWVYTSEYRAERTWSRKVKIERETEQARRNTHDCGNPPVQKRENYCQRKDEQPALKEREDWTSDSTSNKLWSIDPIRLCPGHHYAQNIRGGLQDFFLSRFFHMPTERCLISRDSPFLKVRGSQKCEQLWRLDKALLKASSVAEPSLQFPCSASRVSRQGSSFERSAPRKNNTASHWMITPLCSACSLDMRGLYKAFRQLTAVFEIVAHGSSFAPKPFTEEDAKQKWRLN